MRPIAFLVLLLASPGPALASPLSYDYVDLSYVTVRPDDADFEADGIGVELSRTRSEDAFITAGVSRVETGELFIPDIIPVINDFVGTLITTTLSAGAGAHHGLTEGTDLVFGVSLVFTKVQADGENGGVLDDEDVGLAGNVGVRSALSNRIEGTVSAGYALIFDDSKASLAAGARVWVTSRFALTIEAEMSEDASAYAAGIRFRF